MTIVCSVFLADSCTVYTFRASRVLLDYLSFSWHVMLLAYLAGSVEASKEWGYIPDGPDS